MQLQLVPKMAPEPFTHYCVGRATMLDNPVWEDWFHLNYASPGRQEIEKKVLNSHQD